MHAKNVLIMQTFGAESAKGFGAESDGNCIFRNSLAKLANMVQDKQDDKHTPPAAGGLC